MKKSRLGFSMVEVLVFVSVVAMFFVVAATISSFSLQVAKSNENKILATRYAEELIEWLRGEKEVDWEQFKTNTIPDPPGTAQNYCFYQKTFGSNWNNTSKLNTTCSGFELGSVFNRDLTITPTSDSNQVNVDVTVSWRDGPNTFTVPVKTVFSRFE